MRTYSLKYLSDLDWVRNLPLVIERIDLAATKATVAMRAIGITMPGIGVPTVDDIDAHLRQLVGEAINDLVINDANWPDAGVSDSALFDVSAERDMDGNVDIQILMKLA